LNNGAREGARFASSLPTNDLDTTGGCAAPTSVCSVRDLVDSYLVGGRLNDCGLNGASATNPAQMTWAFSTTGTCPGQLTLTVEREYSFQETIAGAGGPINVMSSRVSLKYPYAWHFNRVIKLLAPGANYAGVTLISTDATAPNMD
jgi:hypothetical protein